MTASTLLPVRIAGTASLAPGPAVSTAELVARLPDGGRPASEVEARTGIAWRHFSEPESQAAALGAAVLAQALETAAVPANALERLIFVTSFGGDALVPATANFVAAALGLRGTCDCFDLNNACMGFLSALDVAARGVATGQGPIGIIVAELPTRFITPEDPRPYLVFGDGVAAAVITGAQNDEGILASFLRNDPEFGHEVTLAHPGLTGRRETIRFASSKGRITEVALQLIRESADIVLSRAGIGVRDVEWVVPHQPNGSMLESIIEGLCLDRQRLVPLVHETGSLGAASIPFGLDRLLRSGRVRRGDRILMLGVGAGASRGATLLRV